jgi:predicted dehydrogenase
MKFLIAGLGSIGRRHFRNLVALGETDIVLYRTHKATLPDDELAGYPVETDLAEALTRHKPDGVIISNPTALHLDVAIPAAKAGCSLLLEKPVSNSMERVDELQSALERGGGRALVGFQFRFHPALQQVRKWVAVGEIGRVISAEVHFGEYLPAWHPWEDYRQGYAARADLGGGVIGTQSHSLDYLPWLVGQKVASVWAFKDKLSDLEVDVEDTVKIGVRFETGALGSFHLDFNQQPPEHTFKIVGTQGTIKWSLADGAARIFRVEKQDWDVYPLPAEFERNVMFFDEMRHFVGITRGEAESLCPLEDGIRVMKFISAIHTSSNDARLVTFN